MLLSSAGRIEGVATRREVLTEPVELHSKDNQTKVIDESSILDAVYLYELLIGSPRTDYSKQEQVQLENAVQSLFVKYGEKCLNKEFIIEMINSEYPEFQINYAYVSSVEKFYKATFRKGHMGTIEMGSASTLLHLKNNDIATI